jgi:hypothetical protein
MANQIEVPTHACPHSCQACGAPWFHQLTDGTRCPQMFFTTNCPRCCEEGTVRT